MPVRRCSMLRLRARSGRAPWRAPRAGGTAWPARRRRPAPAPVCELSTRIGISAVAGSERSRSISSGPSSTGIITSVTIRSGRDSSSALQGHGPVVRLDDPVPGGLEHHLEEKAHIRLVVDDQNRCHRTAASRACSPGTDAGLRQRQRLHAVPGPEGCCSAWAADAGVVAAIRPITCGLNGPRRTTTRFPSTSPQRRARCQSANRTRSSILSSWRSANWTASERDRSTVRSSSTPVISGHGGQPQGGLPVEHGKARVREHLPPRRSGQRRSELRSIGPGAEQVAGAEQLEEAARPRLHLSREQPLEHEQAQSAAPLLAMRSRTSTRPGATASTSTTARASASTRLGSSRACRQSPVHLEQSHRRAAVLRSGPRSLRSSAVPRPSDVSHQRLELRPAGVNPARDRSPPGPPPPARRAAPRSGCPGGSAVRPASGPSGPWPAETPALGRGRPSPSVCRSVRWRFNGSPPDRSEKLTTSAARAGPGRFAQALSTSADERSPASRPSNWCSFRAFQGVTIGKRPGGASSSDEQLLEHRRVALDLDRAGRERVGDRHHAADQRPGTPAAARAPWPAPRARGRADG